MNDIHLKAIREITIRMNMAARDKELESFIKEYILKNKDEKSALSNLGFVIRSIYPDYIEYMNKLLMLT